MAAKLRTQRGTWKPTENPGRPWVPCVAGHDKDWARYAESILSPGHRVIAPKGRKYGEN